MIRELKQMFGISARSTSSSPDPIAVDLSVAIQRNARASEKARDLLRDMLERSDEIKGSSK